MAKIKLKDRSERAKGLIKLLSDTTSTTADILFYGFLSDAEMDAEIIKLSITNPKCPSLLLRKCIQISATNDTMMLHALTLIFSQFKKFDARFWNSISGDIDGNNAEQVRRFVTAQNKILTSNKWIDEMQLKVMFHSAFGFGIGITYTDPLFIEFFTAIFNNKKFDKVLCLTNTKFVTMPDEISTDERYRSIFDSLKRSKNADSIIGWLFEKTGNMVYLSEDAKKIFLWL